MRRHTLPMLTLGIMAVVASACSSVTPTTTASANGSGPSHVYVALGDNGLGGARFRTIGIIGRATGKRRIAARPQAPATSR